MKKRKIKVTPFFWKWSIIRIEHLTHIRSENKKLRKVVLTGQLQGLEDFSVDDLKELKGNLLNDVANIDEVISKKS